jgi:hypothetical protein
LKDILIYGEYSGYGRSLVKGFKALGLDAAVFSPNQDGWKQLETDIFLEGETRIRKLMSLIFKLPELIRYKKVFIMNPEFFNFKLLGPLVLACMVLKRRDIYLLCCGDDVEYIKRGKDKTLNNWVYKNVDLPRTKYYQKISDKLINYMCAKAAIKIIPVMYDYEFCWKKSKFEKKVTEVIPLACDGVDESFEIKKVDKKVSIVIMHGINRKDVKGSDEIIKALKIISKEYSNVKIELPEKLTQKDYLRLLNNVDISIDQCKSNSYGMNGIYCMLKGHILLSSSTELSVSSLAGGNSPVVNICEDASDIAEQLRKLLSLDSLYELKVKSRDYALSIHSPQIIASKIMEVISHEK